MKFTLIATVRNEVDTINTFVESLLNQDRPPEELIIVDGDSDDGTYEALKKYSDNGQLTLISRDCNIAEGRNMGILAAKHEYIAVTDAGCDVDSGWLRNIEKCFQQATDVDVVAGNFAFETHNIFEESVVLATFSPDREKSEHARFFPSSRSVAFRREAWEDVKGYPEWLYAAEDTLFNLRLKELGKTFIFCKEAIVRWRPRQTWKALGKQRFNFGRGNGRVGLRIRGYRKNLTIHLLIVVPLLFVVTSPLASAVTVGAIAYHIRQHLWGQARRAVDVSGKSEMFWRVLAVMEWVRLASLLGFLTGRMDRIRNPMYRGAQVEWMGRDKADV